MVCLNNNDETTCVEDLYFCLAHDLSFTANANMPWGVLSMGMYKEAVLQNYPVMNYLSNNQSYNVLYDLNFNYMGQESFIQFGVNDTMLTELTYINTGVLPNSDVWGLAVDAIEFGEESGGATISFCALTSNVQTIGVPSALFDIIVNEWASGLNFVLTAIPELGISLYALDEACPVDVLSWPDIELTWHAYDLDGTEFT